MLHDKATVGHFPKNIMPSFSCPNTSSTVQLKYFFTIGTHYLKVDIIL